MEPLPIAYFRMCQDTDYCKRYRVENARTYNTTAVVNTSMTTETHLETRGRVQRPPAADAEPKVEKTSYWNFLGTDIPVGKTVDSAYVNVVKEGVRHSVVETVEMKQEATRIAEMLAPRSVAFSPKLLVAKGVKLDSNGPVKVEHVVTTSLVGPLKNVCVIQYRMAA
jgi:hypothetical protein